MADLKVYSTKKIGEVQKPGFDDRWIAIELIDSSNGVNVGVTDYYIDRNGDKKKGKGKWLPVAMAAELGKLIVEASEVQVEETEVYDL